VKLVASLFAGLLTSACASSADPSPDSPGHEPHAWAADAAQPDAAVSSDAAASPVPSSFQDAASDIRAPVCGSVSIDSSAKVVEQPGNVLVIFDRSLTMAGDFATPSGPKPRYLAAGDALLAAITPIADRLSVGAILFPSVNGTLFCTAQVDAISSAENIDFVPGATFRRLLAELLAEPRPELWHLDQSRLRARRGGTREPLPRGRERGGLLLGREPICQSGVAARDRAAAWHARGISTHVVGLPGVVGGAYLTEIARAGGQSDYLAPASTAELQDELSKIVRSTLRHGSSAAPSRSLLQRRIRSSFTWWSWRQHPPSASRFRASARTVAAGC
jgi:hypothetical protein